MQLPENANAAWQKNWFQFVVEKRVKPVVKNIMHIQENEVAPKRLKFTCKCEACSKCISQTIIEVLVHKRWLPKTFAASCKVQKTSKNISIPDVIPPFCSKSRAVHKEDIVVTKFQLPYQVMQKRSTCSPYHREFILLFFLRFGRFALGSVLTFA